MPLGRTEEINAINFCGDFLFHFSLWWLYKQVVIFFPFVLVAILVSRAQWLAAQDALKLKPCYLADWSRKPQAGLLLTCSRGTAPFYLVARVCAHRQHMCLLPVNVPVGVMLAFLALGCEENSHFCDKCVWHVRVCLIHAEIYTSAPSDFCGSRSGA